MPKPTPFPRRLPPGAYLIPTEVIIGDERTVATLGGDGLIDRAPRWELWVGGRWIAAAPFVRPSDRMATLAQVPSAMPVVARPMPPEYCAADERPADPVEARGGLMGSIAARNVAAEVRFVEEGHRAILQPGGALRVVSDSFEGKAYRVEFTAIATGAPIRFSCQPEGRAAFTDDHLLVASSDGVVPCKHAAGAARRLEREGLAALDAEGRWVATEKACPARPQPADPFAGLV